MVKLKKAVGEKAFDIFNTVFLILLSMIMLYPFLFVISHSLMTDAERALRPLALIPNQINLSGYKFILTSDSMLMSGYKVTLQRIIVGTCLSLLCESMFAYALSKKQYPLRNFLTVMIAFTMWFSAGVIPFYLTVSNLRLINSFWSLILPSLVGVWNILIMRNFFAQIPDSLDESARIDGANEFTILFRVILPLSTPVLATIGLFHIVYNWNEWFNAMLFITKNEKLPVMMILRKVLVEANKYAMREEGITQLNVPSTAIMQMTSIVLVAFPLIVVYPFFQRYFIKGMLMGSIKG